jgi:hypothetical protein
MISDQPAIQSLARTAATPMWRVAVGGQPLSAVLAAYRRVGGALRDWVKVPLLPYAALWEATILIDLLKQREYFEPDPYSAETPFLTGSWPRA